MTAEREMTLHEWVGKLPEIHLARKELVAMQERIAELEKAVKDMAELAHMSHTYCEDGWYSCPMAEDGCADESRGSECDCGAVEHNAKIDAIRSAAGYLGEGE